MISWFEEEIISFISEISSKHVIFSTPHSYFFNSTGLTRISSCIGLEELVPQRAKSGLIREPVNEGIHVDLGACSKNNFAIEKLIF